MPESKTVEEKPKEEPIAKDDEVQTEDAIYRAEKAAERLEKANENFSELLARQERNIVEQKLGGKAEAGTPAEKEETIEDKQVKAIMEAVGSDND